MFGTTHQRRYNQLEKMGMPTIYSRWTGPQAAEKNMAEVTMWGSSFLSSQEIVDEFSACVDVLPG